jgi:hypothetical protein
LLVLVPTAGAATVSMPPNFSSPGTVRAPSYYYRFSVEAAAGETNRLAVDHEESARIRVTDTGTPLTAGENCRPDGGGVLCSVDTGDRSYVSSAEFDLGDNHDELRIAGSWAVAGLRVLGGTGDDLISVPDTAAVVDGGPGGDTMTSPRGMLTYAGRTVGVSVTADGVANDGEPGERDDVGTFTSVTGGNGDDELHAADVPSSDGHDLPPNFGGGGLVGGLGADHLIGGPSADRLSGGGGNDTLLGGDGPDALDGGTGGDVLRGGDGVDNSSSSSSFHSASGVDVTLDDRPGDGAPGENDDAGSDIEQVHGTPADDLIVGSDVDNVIDGLGGNDVLDGAGGADTIYGSGRVIGGPGADILAASSGSVEARDGERDEILCSRPAVTYDVDPFDALPFCAPTLNPAVASTLRARRDGIIRHPISCIYWRVEYAKCTGRLYLYRRDDAGRTTPIGRARFELPAGDTEPRVVAIRLTRSARSELAAKRRLRVVLEWRTRNVNPPTWSSGHYNLKIMAPR